MVRILAFIALFLPSIALSQPKASLTVQPFEGSRDEEFTLTLDVWGISDPSTVTPYLIGGDSFKVNLTGKQLGVVTENGNTTTSISFSYSLFPKEIGVLKTPGAEVQVDGKVLRVESQSVTVKPGPIDVPTETGDIFLKQRVDISNPYIGQQIVLIVDIYTAVNLIQPRIDITAPGFLQEELGKESKHERIVNGTRYEVISLRRSLFPQKEGTTTIPSQTLTAMVRERSRGRLPFQGGLDPFDFMMGFDNVVSKTFRSSPTEVNVRPLPQGTDSKTIVGETTVTSSISSNVLKLGESATLTVTVESAGDLSLINSVPIEFPSWIKVYADSPEKEKRIRNGRLYSTRTFKVSLVPTTGGKAILPEIAFSYLDPESGEIKEARSGQISIEALGPLQDSKPLNDSGQSSRNEVSGDLSEEKQGSFREISTGAGLLALAVSILLFTIVLFWHRITTKRREIDPLEPLSNAKSLKSLYDETCKLISPDGSPVREALRRKIADKSIRYSAETLLDDLENAIFGGNGQGEIEGLKLRAIKLASDIGRFEDPSLPSG